MDLQNNHNKIMSAYNNSYPRQNFMASSSMFFTNTPISPHNNYPFQPNTTITNRQPNQLSSSEAYLLPPQRNMVTQSVIYAPRNEVKPKVGGLSKLQSMARHISTPQNEEFPSQKRNSCDKTPYQREPFHPKQPNPFISQIIPQKNTYNWPNNDQTKIIVTEPLEMEARKRRESVDLETPNRRVGNNAERFKFLQKAPQFQAIKSNSAVEKHDCQSTNSGSGTELVKPKNFDFLRKRKQGNEGMPNSPSNPNQALKPFQAMKKSDMMWPLSISPMEQKSPKLLQTTIDLQPNSAGKFQRLHPTELGHNSHTIQFKKKKNLEGPVTPVTRPELPSRLEVPSKPVWTETKPKQKQEKEPILLKGKSSKPQRQLKIEDFQLMNKLGKGAFGQVYMAMQKVLGFACVIKKMSKKRIRQAKVEEHIIRQIKLQSYLNHSHITSLFGYFHDQDYLYLILQLLPDGSLQQVKKKKKLPEKQAADIVRQVAQGLKHMHQQYIIHRDLKPQNLFVNEGYVKIGDLGCSIFHNMSGLRNTIVGCLEYSSPQQLSQQGYTDKIDSWSLGIMTYQLLFGKSPFESEIKKMAMSGQNKGELSEVSFPSAPVVREQTKQFILNLLDREPDRRMDMDQVLAHPFLGQERK